MGRVRKGTAPGRASDFTGEKKEFLESFYDRLLEAGFGSGGDPGNVYTEVTDEWLRRYGYDLPFQQNVEGDPLEKPPVDQPHTPEEKTAIRKTLRTKIAGWYRSRYRNKKVHGATLKQILTTMQSMSGTNTRPRCTPAVVLYSKLHYATRIKPDFDKLWASVKDTTPATARVSMSRDFVRTCWEKESDSFREDIETQAKEMHRVAMEEWKGKRVVPEHSAETYHAALEGLNDVGIPLVDALAEHLGMHIVLMAVGPVGNAGGEVLLRSVFSDTASGATSKTWPQFDHAGFTAMEKSITRYGRAFFTKAECQERVWPSSSATEDTTPPNLNGLLPIDSRANSECAASGTVPTASTPDIPPMPIASTTPSAPAAPTTAPSAPVPLTAAVGTPLAAMEDLPLLDEIDRSEWSDTLLVAHPYFMSKNWGPQWTGLIEALVRFEWSWYHNDMHGRLDSVGRPPEFAQWMKEHRVWDDYKITDDFGHQLLEWWKVLGPWRRWEDVPKGEAPSRETTWQDWGRIGASGANGPILLVLGLAWWGQTIWNAGAATGLGGGEAALAAADDWHLLAEDLRWALETVLPRDRVGDEQANAEEKAEGKKEVEAKKGKKGKKALAKKDPSNKRKRATNDEAPESTGKRTKRQATATGPAGERDRPKPRPLTRSSRAGKAEVEMPTTLPVASSAVGNTGNEADNPRDDPSVAAHSPPDSTIATATAIREVAADASAVPVVPTASGSTVIGGAPPLVPSHPCNKTPDQEDDSDSMHVDSVNVDGGKVDRLIDETELDPFAGLTEEELAEIRGDPHAGEDDDDGEA
ncbi:hypothetical protein MSAN_00446600 [Mycena sanguinolenta]|uniref:Uncharacterized protein n=1 Tax=Mycena sanguinolenta TaxID=230812 RepID=A0A8H7DJH3_9AGAR|nr:hypothetical protein MSAN_00446600 [Mycena sanguinolenta]